VNLNLHSRGVQQALTALILSLFASGSAIAGQAGTGLKVVIVEGSGTRSVVSQSAPGPIKLRVLDANNLAVSGATVVFTSPASGPSCFFLNGAHSMIVFTDQQGLAVAQDYYANSIVGGYQIQVQAAYKGDVATLSIQHMNVVAKKSSTKTFLIGAAAAGGAVATILAVKGGGSSGSTPGGSSVPTIVLLGSSVKGTK
jgi:hypothetical protein